MIFFERQPELPQPFPKATDADLQIMLRHEPGLQFGERRVGFAHDAGTKGFVMRGKLRFGTPCPRTRARLSGPLPSSQNFVDIRHADPEDGRRSIRPVPESTAAMTRSRRSCEEALPITIPPSNQRWKRITNGVSRESPGDSVNNEEML
jgi:hypothetical protein